MNRWFFLFLLPIIRFLINYNNSLYLRSVLRWHNKYLDGIAQSASEDKKNISQKAARWLQTNQTEIKRRVLNAGVGNPTKSYMEPLGLGYAQQQNVRTLDNLLLLNEEILSSARQIITIAEGHYRTQAWLSLSPLYWVEMVVFLPKEIVKMAGFEATSKIVQGSIKVVQLIYWAIMIVYAITLLNK